VPVQEADIEILTAGPRDVIQCTNQPSVDSSGNVITAATVNATIPHRQDWSTWNNYRLDWVPTQSSWYINGYSVANISFQVPRDPAGLIANMWSDGSSWTGNMTLHDESYFQIQYIELVYNTSGPHAGTLATERHENLAKKAVIPLFGAGAASRDSALPRGKSKDQPRDTSSSAKGCRIVCSIDKIADVSGIGIPVIVANNTSGASPRMKLPISGPLTEILGYILFCVAALLWL
jgi:hypothetical protein